VSISWQEAAQITALIGLAALAARLVLGRARVVSDVLTQCAILFALYAIWQLLLDHTVTSTTGAVSHGRWVWRVERTFHLPSEKSVQHAVLSHGWLVTFFNQYYRIAHYGGLLIALAWVFFFHRQMYRWCRRMLVFTTALLTVPFQSVVVAPPRFLPELGLVDTAHPNYSSGILAGLRDPGQLTAMPSVHVAWAVLVAVIIVSVSTSRWRWLGLAYPALTMIVVVATGNHFWADGIVGAAVVAVVVLADWLVRRTRVAHPMEELAPVPS
jgi:hypothetical protein